MMFWYCNIQLIVGISIIQFLMTLKCWENQQEEMYHIKSPIKTHINRLACLRRVKEQQHHKQVDEESCSPLAEDHCLFNMGIAIGHQQQFPSCLTPPIPSTLLIS